MTGSLKVWQHVVMRNSCGLRIGAVLLLVAVVGCAEQSRVDPEATIGVGGTVLAADGSPLADRPVKLGAGISDSEGALAVLTVGLSCTSGECRGAVRSTTTDAAGNYRFSLRGHETQSSFGEAVSVLVSATGERPADHVSGALTSARFRVQTEDVTVPSLALVDPGLVVEGDVDVAARWATDRPPPYELTFEGEHAIPAWRVETAEGGASVDARVLEDSAGRVVVGGGYEEAIEGSDVLVRWRSPGRGYAAGAGPAPSRGARCRWLDGAGRSVVSSPCELTDGDVARPAGAPAVCTETASERAPGSCPAATVVEVVLGATVPGELVVVRGCEGGCAVEVTADGVDYRAVGAAAEEFSALALDGRPVTAVRVGLGSSPSALREVSVWGPRPDRPALRALDGDARADLGAPFGNGGGEGGGVPAALSIAAAVLAAAAFAGAGFVLGRRRSGR